MRRAWEAWDRFFFRPGTARVLGLYRIVFGLIVLYSFGLLAPNVSTFFSDEGLMTSAVSAQLLGSSYLTLFEWLRSPGQVRAVLVALFVAAFFFTVGFQTRWSALALLVLVVSFHVRNSLVLHGGDAVIRTMLFFFAMSPSGAAFSVDSLRRRLRAPGGGASELRVLPWAQRMMQIQVAIIYIVAAGAKMMGDRYWDGSAMYYMLGRLDIHVRGLEQLMNYPAVYTAMTVAAIAMEIPMPLLLWFRATRPWASLVGVALHLWIMAFMVIPGFGIVMMTSYLVFYGEEDLERVLARMRRRSANRRAALVVPQGSRWARLLPILDVLGRLDVKEAADASGPRLVTSDGKAREGLRAAAWIVVRLLAVFWAVPALYLPERASAVDVPATRAS